MKITVIGAGILGLTTAYFLQQKGHSVVLVDRQNGPGLETSYANGGMLTPSQSAPWNSPDTLRNIWKLLASQHGPLKIRPAILLKSLPWCLKFIRNSSLDHFLRNQRNNFILAEYSLRQIRILRELLSLNYDFKQDGTLKLFRSKQEMDQGLELCTMLHDANYEFNPVDKNGLTDIEPAMQLAKDNYYGGIYFPEDESGDAYKFCQSLSSHLTTSVECKFDTNVVKIHRNRNEITGIETSKGLITSDLYVLAAGSYSKQLGEHVGLQLPIQPVKGFSVSITLPDHEEFPNIPVIDESRHIAITPFSNRLRIAGMAELCGYNLNIPVKRIDFMMQYLNELYPQYSKSISNVEVVPWTGLRPYSCDGVPVLGKCEINNLFLNTGHGHLGWTMSVGSAKVLADMINDETTEIDISAYHIDRF